MSSSLTTHQSDAAVAVSPWEPLRDRIFRFLWIASFVSNIGGWMQTVGAQWFLLDARASSTVVALVQSASSLPVLLLTLPAGVLAEFVNRRHMLLAVQSFQVVTTALLCLLTFSGSLNPTVLLLMTFLLGCGSAVQIPAYQALIPTLVPATQIGAAASLSSIGVNLARAVGPAVAGLLVTSLGVGGLFVLNGVTFLLFVLTLLLVPDTTAASSAATSSTATASGTSTPGNVHLGFLQGLQAGGRYVRHSPFVRRAIARLVIFVVPANVLWALLPLVAHQRLGMSSAGYGVLLAAAGAGAVAGAVLMPHLARHLSPTARLASSGVVFGLGMLALSVVRSPALAVLVLLPVGVAWILVIAGLNAAVQSFLPPWVRARALSIYQVVLFSATAASAAVWGVVAEHVGLAYAFALAGLLLLLGAVSAQRWGLRAVETDSRQMVDFWAAPAALAPTHPTSTDPALTDPALTDPALSGPALTAPASPAMSTATAVPSSALVLVEVRYEVPEQAIEPFIRAAAAVQRSRRRTGALSWNLYRSVDKPGCLVEQFTVADWNDHLAQHHERLTRADQRAQEQLRSLATQVHGARHLVRLPTAQLHSAE